MMTSIIINIVQAVIIIILLVYIIISKHIKVNDGMPISFLTPIICDFEKINNTLEYFLDKSYQMVYQTDIAAYQLSGVFPDEEANIKLCNKYIETLEDLMGQNLLQYYYQIYGGKEIFINNCLLYFNTQMLGNDLKHSVEYIAKTDTLGD